MLVSDKCCQDFCEQCLLCGVMLYYEMGDKVVPICLGHT
jgi:hypothetical protein